MMVKQGGGLLMMGIRMLSRLAARCLIIATTTLAVLGMLANSAVAVVVLSDGFGDADRNNNGIVEFYDTDINNSGTWNDPVEDADQLERNITEVTAATDPSDAGLVWSGIRSFDSAANDPKFNLKIINDSVVTGTETAQEIHNDGLALGAESKGGSSRFMGRFPQSIALGSSEGDKLVVSFDFRAWKEADNPDVIQTFNQLRWGLFQDTDDELGQTGPRGDGFTSDPPGETVEWGKDDGNWWSANNPGAEGDKGIFTNVTFGSLAAAVDSRIHWEWNVAGINGTTNPGEIMTGNGVSNTPGSGGDMGTVATPVGGVDGPGGIIMGDTYAPHKLSMEFARLADGRIEVASFIDDTEILRDDIKTTDTGYNVIGPPADTFDYIAFNSQSSDFDMVIDNFKVELFSTSAGVPGDYNNNGTVDAADYVLWRNGGPLQNEIADVGTVSPADYSAWRAAFGNPGAGSAIGASVPEPGTAFLLMIGAIAWRALFPMRCRRENG
jgi:hypothetical protein